MKHFNKLLSASLLLGVFILFSSYKDKADKNQTILNVMMQGLGFGHFQPEEINDEFSHKVFDLYLKRLDYNKRFFIKDDIEKMKQYRDALDEQTKEGKYDFFLLSQEIFAQRLAEVKEYYTEILSKPFDFTLDENMQTNPKKTVWAESKEKLRDNWRKALKYETMTRLNDLIQAQEKAIEKKDTTYKVITPAQMEEDARKKTLKANDEWIKRINSMEKNEWQTIYLNAIANTFDPHTEFFPPKDKARFDAAMSGQFEGIGAQLQEKDGQIKVDNIIPGSASWRQGQLKAGDIIIKVAQGSDDPVEVTDMRLDKVVEKIRGKKGTEVRLTVRKLDGSVMVIPIIRDVVVIEETYAQSLIITENGKRTGYIKLPLFYADFNKMNGRRCSEDVRKEVEKLKAEKVDGIIIDLRYNGGGSLDDVVKMAGLFIPKGPVVQIKDRYNAPQVLEDPDDETVYNGPLAIMVNTSSASASEILAAAMQDYKRAVIIGSPSTYGKGTVQKFMDLDMIAGDVTEDVKPLGQVKLTIQKFYRVSGGTTQLKGVVPDVVLPDAYAYIDEAGEKEQEYPLKWDEIAKAQYTTFPKYNISALSLKSKERVKKDKTFTLAEEEARRVKKTRDNTLVSLNLEKYKAELKIYKEEGKKFDDIHKEIPGVEVSQLKADIKENSSDSVALVRTKDMMKSIKKDIYIHEAANIIGDMKQ